jgi:hypothetical protein
MMVACMVYLEDGGDIVNSKTLDCLQTTRRCNQEHPYPS